MAGEPAAAALQVLVQNLIDVSKDEISLIRGLEKEVERLTGNLDNIQKFLNDAETRANPGEAVKTWLKKLENVAFDADNVLDEVNYHLLSKKIKKTMKRTEKEKLLTCFSPFIHMAGKRKVAVRIKEINMELESINKMATEHGLQTILAVAPTVSYAGRETDAITVDPIFIGRDDVVSEIVEMLTTSVTTDDERVFSILPIVGMGGLGKTTLTRKVFNHEKIKTQFGSCIWVHVSQNFDPNILFKKILTELTSQSYPVESRQEFLKKIQESLKDKTYFLVLDDVWNKDLPKWEDFMNALSGVTSTKGNGIIITTRDMEVASIVKPLHIHRLDGLSKEDCWSIIKAKTSGKEDVPLGFETIGRKIAKRCQGSPLAANVVGGMLCNKSEDEWLSIEHKWLSGFEGDNITKILRLSFDHLSSPSLKKCFAYCSIFPKGDKIAKEELIEFWMAEGFLQPDGDDDMDSVGDKFYNVLLQSSLLQVAKRERYDYENKERCVLHDLVHDLASVILGSNNADGITRVRYMNQHRVESGRIPKEVAKNLRTLFFLGSPSYVEFSEFKCLHVLTLTLMGIGDKELPSAIRKLIHLRYLNVSRSSITHLPEWIGELYHLQTLRAENLRKLPSTLKYLINIRHLYLGPHVELPAEIGMLTSLQTLTNFTVFNINGLQIEALGSLNNLKGNLEIRSLGWVHDKEEAERANLFKKSKLSNLRLEWGSDETNHENVLDGLQPHPNLKRLDIYGFQGKRFPLWTLKMAVRNVTQDSWIGLSQLMEIKLESCGECEEIPMLGHLPNLKSIYLYDLRNVKSINSSFYGIDKQDAGIVFPALERLELYNMPKLTEWANVEFAGASEVKVFPHLQYLNISNCKRLINAQSHLSCMSKLTTLLLDGLEMECLPDRLFYNNQNLGVLQIRNCPTLSKFPYGLHTLDSLEELNIVNCPNLKWIAHSPSSKGSLMSSLRIMEISECHELIDFPCEMVESSSLERLKLEGLSGLKNLPRILDCLAKPLPCLRELEIAGVPKFMANSGVEIIWHFPSLIELKIDASMEGSMETVDGILQGCCNSLDLLYLKGMEIWECLPESIQHLTRLSALQLNNFGIQELPEWFGNLISLESSGLSDCKKLRRLPSTHVMRRLIRLRGLRIKGCPELRIEQQRDYSPIYFEDASASPADDSFW